MPEWIADILKQAAAIILAVSPLLIPQIRDFVAKKIQLSFDKALEDRKAINARIIDISKMQFEKEFEVYREISRAVAFLVYGSDFFFNRLVENKTDVEFVRSKTLESLVCAEKIVGENAPFIQRELAVKYRKILGKCDELLRIPKESVLSETQYQIVKKIRDEIIGLNEDIENSLRDHLESLKKIQST